MEPATDLDYLISRGYPEDKARDALKRSQGDVRQAYLLLRDGTRDTSWLKSGTDDWIDHIPSKALPTDAESRALWKSPVYVRIGSWTRRDENGQFTEHPHFILTVTMRDARQWTLRKAYSDFYNLWTSLPNGSCSDFKNPFPQPTILGLLVSLTDEKIEQRRQKLEEWIRELCLNERCMANENLIKIFYKFLEEDKHHSNPTPILTKTPITPNIFTENIRPYTNVKSLSSQPFPLQIPQLTKQLPCKIPILQIFSGSHRGLIPQSESGKDNSDEQLARDIERDRVVVNGVRMVGSKAGLPAILETAVDIASQVQQSANIPISPQYSLERFCKSALRHATRTESAFLSHTARTLLLDMSAHPDVMIVPESSLAEPLILDFKVSSSEPSNAPRLLPGSDKIIVPAKLTSSRAGANVGRPQLVCDIQAATVYRVTDGATMDTLLQLKVTYVMHISEGQTIQTPPSTTPSGKVTSAGATVSTDAPPPPGPAPAPPGNTNSEKATSSTLPPTPPSVGSPRPDPFEQALLVLERETTTTTRDWRGDQKL